MPEVKQMKKNRVNCEEMFKLWIVLALKGRTHEADSWYWAPLKAASIEI